ncbi:hypothetical protein O9929_17910 [Vibrio lentus]|nr:hypothetical protein [Vibrio lentus]
MLFKQAIALRKDAFDVGAAKLAEETIDSPRPTRCRESGESSPSYSPQLSVSNLVLW